MVIGFSIWSIHIGLFVAFLGQVFTSNTVSYSAFKGLYSNTVMYWYLLILFLLLLFRTLEDLTLYRQKYYSILNSIFPIIGKRNCNSLCSQLLGPIFLTLIPILLRNVLLIYQKNLCFLEIDDFCYSS